MNRRDFLKRAGAGFAALSLPGWLAAGAEPVTPHNKPNIILILADDLGLGDVGCYGGPFPTPNIDALAKGGTRFEYCFATPKCGPSRAQLLTGRYPFRTGLNDNNSSSALRPGREIMIPTVMQKAGYVTTSIGKWGQVSRGPGEWGFDEYLVFRGSGRYWKNGIDSYIVNGKTKDLHDGEYVPDLMHNFLVDFIQRHKNRPFFAYYPMSHVHAHIKRTPDSKPGATFEQLYADNVAYMDKLVGKLVAELDRLKLSEKTLVIFAGDNGTASDSAGLATIHGRRLDGAKASMLEGGSRVPLIANWPGTTPAGVVNHDLTDFTDFLTTFAELGGAPLPQGVTLDGRSFAPQLKGEKGKPREWVYVELRGRSYVRNARFKLTNDGGFFDMKNAPFEEIAVPADTKDPDAIAARKRLRLLLEQHPAIPR